MDNKDIQCTKDQMEWFMNNLAEQSSAIIFPDKCDCCPYMFEYKCRASECVYEVNSPE